MNDDQQPRKTGVSSTLAPDPTCPGTFRPKLLCLAPDPYEVLRDIGVGYQTSMRDLHLLCQQAQQRGQLTPERAHAWSVLRNVEQRLLLDLLFLSPDAGFGNGDPRPEPPAELHRPPLPEPQALIPPPPAEVLTALLGQVTPPEAVAVAVEPVCWQVDLWALLAEALPPPPAPPSLAEPDPLLEDT